MTISADAVSEVPCDYVYVYMIFTYTHIDTHTHTLKIYYPPPYLRRVWHFVFAKFNFKIYYLPPHLREVWHYKEANADLIKRAIININWEKAFSNINEKVSLFNKTILNFLSNYILHQTIMCNDKDPHVV